jgi:hypothetical protein
LKYLASVGLVFLFQAAVTYAIVRAGTGGGSFVGLGALLFAVMGIPVTAIVNLLLIRANPTQTGFARFFRSFLIALVLPVAQVGLLVAVSVFRL